MKTFEYVAVAALALIVLGYVNSQGDEPTLDTCNFRRLDVSDCIIDRPTANQYSIFATRLVASQSGTLQCRVFRRRTVTRDVVNLDQSQLRIVFSPGFLLDPPELYANQQLVVYNVQCAPNEFAFFRLLELETEDHNCPNLNTGALRCQDYVSVTDDGSGIIESCGTDPGNNDMRLLDHNFTVAFRTHDRRRAAGFRGYAVCYEPELTDSEGCTEAPGDEVNNTETRRRRKRDLEHFHNHWRWRMHRMKRQGVEFRLERHQILNGDIVRYQNEQLFIDRTDPDASTVFDNVAFLRTFNVNGPEFFFKTTDLPFIGPGPLVILGEYAYFQQFAIDPRGVIPTQAEAVLIGNLTDAQFDLVNAFMDVRGRRKRQIISSDDFSDETVIIAIQNERACNPLLRAQANGVLSLVDSGRIEMLRAQLEATTPPAPVTTPPVTDSTTPVTSTTPVEELTGTTTDDMSSTTPPGDGGTGFSL